MTRTKNMTMSNKVGEAGSSMKEPTGYENEEEPGSISREPAGAKNLEEAGYSLKEPARDKSHEEAGSSSNDPAGAKKGEKAGSALTESVGAKSIEEAGSSSKEPEMAKDNEEVGSCLKEQSESKNVVQAGSISQEPKIAKIDEQANSCSKESSEGKNVEQADASLQEPVGQQHSDGKTVKELKKEVEKFVRAVVDNENCNVENIDRVIKALKDLKLKLNEGSGVHSEIPKVSGPVSKEPVGDPVNMASEETTTSPKAQAEEDNSDGKTVTELKKYVGEFVMAVADNEGYSSESVDNALLALKELKWKVNKERGICLAELKKLCPDEFKCPLSKEMMTDPVIVASGETYDRSSIENHLKAGNHRCSVTHIELEPFNLTRNLLMRELIEQWCTSNGVELAGPPIPELDITEDDLRHLVSLINKLHALPEQQKQAAAELRQLTRTRQKFRVLFHEPSIATDRIVNLLHGNNVCPEACVHLITTLFNITLADRINQKYIGGNPKALAVLVDALHYGNTETRCNSAMTLFNLSSVDSNKEPIGQAGALNLLVKLLGEADHSVIRDYASPIFKLCYTRGNTRRAVRAGIVEVIMERIRNVVCLEEMLCLLALISSNQQAVKEMTDQGVIPLLLHFIRDNYSEENKENSVVILHAICKNNETKWKEMEEEEDNHGSFSNLEQTGTPSATRKAADILKMIRRQ